MPCFLGEPKQRDPQEQSGENKEKSRTIGAEAKKLTCKKYRKQECSAYAAAQRQYDAVAQQACAVHERTKCMLLPTAAPS